MSMNTSFNKLQKRPTRSRAISVNNEDKKVHRQRTLNLNRFAPLKKKMKKVKKTHKKHMKKQKTIEKRKHTDPDDHKNCLLDNFEEMEI